MSIFLVVKLRDSEHWLSFLAFLFLFSHCDLNYVLLSDMFAQLAPLALMLSAMLALQEHLATTPISLISLSVKFVQRDLPVQEVCRSTLIG